MGAAPPHPDVTCQSSTSILEKIDVHMVSTFGRAGRSCSPVPQLRILVIDDHPQSRNVLRHVLVTRGHECIAVSSPADALQAIDSVEIDIVIYEPHAPTGRRAGIARMLRERAAARGGSLWIMALSTQEESTDFKAAEGVDAYVQKPFDADALNTALVLRGKDRA